MADKPEHLPSHERPDVINPGPGRPTPTPPIVQPPRKQPKRNPEGPDLQSAAPTEGGDTLMTSAGPLDRETVLSNRVGGTGWVSIQEEPNK